MIENLQVVGGRSEHSGLNSSLSEPEYEGVKVVVWWHSLKAGRIPVKWYKPTKNGTKFRWVTPKSDAEAKEAVEKFKNHIAEVNDKYGLGITIEPKEEQTT